jgi:hypothetical protein
VSAKKASATKVGGKKVGGKKVSATKTVGRIDVIDPIDPIDPDRLTLLARPVLDPALVAAVTAAAPLVWPQPAPPDEQDPAHQTWRFSGRWWNKPVPLRRDRPWARR